MVTDTPTPERGEPEAVRCVRRLAKDGRDMRWEGSLLREYDALRRECARKDAKIARLRGALKDLYERMDCSLCRTSPDFAFCGGCIADRERARTLLNPGAPRDGE